MKDSYKNQVALLLEILPLINKEDVFALHGGTAINLFTLNMPRLSVDIDLTYIPASSNRNRDLSIIRTALADIKLKLKKHIPGIQFSDQARAEEELKLICTAPKAMVKIEVNQINRGLIAEPEMRALCRKAQETFDKYCEIRTVSQKQLWGGKVCATLDRQHPRDLFDIRHLFEDIGFSEEIKDGFIFFLLCSKRPIHEILKPHLIDQSAIFQSHFKGMTDDESFGYDEYLASRESLIKIVNESLTKEDKAFIQAFSKGEPDWSRIDYGQFPAIQWKLRNINQLRKENHQKYKEQIELFERIV